MFLAPYVYCRHRNCLDACQQFHFGSSLSFERSSPFRGPDTEFQSAHQGSRDFDIVIIHRKRSFLYRIRRHLQVISKIHPSWTRRLTWTCQSGTLSNQRKALARTVPNPCTDVAYISLLVHERHHKQSDQRERLTCERVDMYLFGRTLSHSCGGYSFDAL